MTAAATDTGADPMGRLAVLGACLLSAVAAGQVLYPRAVALADAYENLEGAPGVVSR